MSAWKLVEAVVEPVPSVEDPSKNSANDSWRQGRGGDSNRGGGGGRGRKGRTSRGGGSGGSRGREMDAQTRKYYAHMAVQQIEYLFSDENLCMDTFLRSYMDEAGFVPLGLVCSYQNVACYGPTAADLVEVLQERPEAIVEIDSSYQTIKLKEKWEMWLMPNGTGGRGLPLYSQQVFDPQAASLYYGTEAVEGEYASENPDGQAAETPSVDELSAAAPVFLPSASR